MHKLTAVICVLMVTLSATVCCAAEGSRMLRVLFLDSEGGKIPRVEIREFHCRDLADEPIITRIDLEDGAAVIELPKQSVQLSGLLNVPGFGEVTVYADGRGKGYTDSGTIDFAREAAVTRGLRVALALVQARKEGVLMPQSFSDGLSLAARMPIYESLASTLKAGEDLTLARARHRISKMNGPRKGFLLGCNAFGYPARGPLYQDRFRELFNFGTTNLYLSRYAPEPDRRDYGRTDNETEWLRSTNMAVKPCPPFYMARSVTPEWLKNLPYPEVRKAAHELVSEVTRRYAGKTEFCEIVNEAHDYSNSLDLTAEQLVDIADVCSRAAREGDPNVKRIINCCHLWADYGARPGKDGRARRSPYVYIRDCIKAGVEFEIVGLQLYYPEYDLFEIDRMLDRYATLGKPIHITEMGCSSAPGIDPDAQRKKAAAGWHGPWTEEMQADWVEGVYTIFYSKPYIEAVSWWDLADAVSFWPYGGLCRGDVSPKPAYVRLQALLREWGFAAGAQ